MKSSQNLEESKSRLPWIKGESPVQVSVIGDLILDEYLEGQVHRISPEAPVPVHLVGQRSLTAGGAANVARNIKLSGGSVKLYGVLGDDEAGKALKDILHQDQVDLASIASIEGRPTIRKTRVTANHQQLLRLDWEEVSPLPLEFFRNLKNQLAEDQSQVLLVSDYGKGCLSDDFTKWVIDFAKRSGKKVVVDPKGNNYEKYRGAHLITPNLKEACLALGLDQSEQISPAELAIRLRDQFGIDQVIVTLGAQGMVGVTSGTDADSAIHLAAKTREVFDVSGAGDTVVALMALGLGSGMNLRDAMVLANVGAGLVVEKWGTQPIQQQELEASIETESSGHHSFNSTKKIIHRAYLNNYIAPIGSRRSKIVFTNGCFDILHAGHVQYLEDARAMGDVLIVAVNDDHSISRLKGPSRPIVPLEQRMRTLAGLGCVDFVVSFSEDTPEQIISEVLPDILVKGADYRVDQIVGASEVLSHGGVVETIPFVEGISSSRIIERIQEDHQH